MSRRKTRSIDSKTTVSVLLNSDKQGYTVKIVPAVEHKNKEPIKEITKNHISTLSNKQWRNLAKRELAKVGITFAKTVTNLVLEQKIIENKIKNVPLWSSKKAIEKKTFTQEPQYTKSHVLVSNTPIQESSTPKPIGYVSRCRQDEPINLDPEVFYKSWRWKELRLIVLDKCGRRCCSCGATPRPDNQVVLHVDHIKPLRIHPKLALDISNLQVLCEDCNQGKSWYHSNDYRSEEQRNKLIDMKLASIKVTESAITSMHDSLSQ